MVVPVVGEDRRLRQEDKEVDGPELEHAEERKRENELVEEKAEEIHDLDGQPYEMEGQRDKDRSGMVVSAMRKILEGERIVNNDLKLSPRELKALEALQTAKTGRDGQLDRFVYAEDRRALLEQSLAVLQPDVVQLEREAGKPFVELMSEVSGLREKLNSLQDSEEEVMLRHGEIEKAETDTDDKPKPDDDQTLTGPERKLDKPTSDLGGPERKLDKPTSDLGGPERKIEKPATTLTGGAELKDAKKPETTLTGGAELKDAKKPETSLGDAKDIAEAEKKPWWRSSRG
jgi:hypothetical protein